MHSLILRTGPLLIALAAVACGEQRVTPPTSRGRIAVSSGDQQHGAPGQRLAQPIVILARDLSDAPIAGVPVTWVADDGGTIDPAESITGPDGRAVATWTLGTTSSSHRAHVIANGFGQAEFVALNSLDGELPLDVLATLSFTTYEGSGQTVHPDFVAMGSEWPAVREYLFITPYPNGNSTYENPSLFESANLVHWTIPTGVTNPLVGATNGYLSDPDAVYVAERGELWLYFREVNAENIVRLSTSPDGVSWSAPVMVAHAPNHQIISPTVVRRGPSEWLMWAVNGNDGCAGSTARVELRRSSNGVSWSGPQVVDLVQPGLWPWHIDVEWIPARGQFWALYNVKIAGSCATDAVYLATSVDGLHWTTYPSPVLTHGAIPAFQDIVYRSTFAYDAATDEITIWYSGARYDGKAYVWSSAVQRRRREDLFSQIQAPVLSALAVKRPLPSLVNFP